MRKLLSGVCLTMVVLFMFSSCGKEDDLQPETPEATCDDGIQNGDETGIDCGGSCAPCTAVPTCDDGIQNGDETGIDCGGSCTPCTATPTCDDGIQNGDETGIDCGGTCTPCTSNIMAMKDYIEQTPRFSMLQEAIVRAAFDLHTVDGDFTLFAPNNEAWTAFLENNNWSSIDDVSPSVLKIILEVQFSDMGKYTSDLFEDNYQIQIVYQDRKIHVNLSAPNIIEMVAGLSKAKVIERDMEMTNGIIHETDGILVF